MTVRVFSDSEALARAAAEHIAGRARDAIGARGVFRIALAGGSTPNRTYAVLAADGATGSGVPWDNVEVYWGDERFVPAGDPANSAASARTVLLDHVPIREEAVYPVPTPDDVSTVEVAAERYEGLLRAAATDDPAGVPLDLVLLGLGEDGHTASLFPGDPLLKKRVAGDGTSDDLGAAWARAVLGPDTRPPRERITLTLAAIEASREAVFLVNGAAKAGMLRRVLIASGEAMNSGRAMDAGEAADAGQLPAAMVRARCGVTWFVDRAAYSEAAGEAD